MLYAVDGTVSDFQTIQSTAHCHAVSLFLHLRRFNQSLVVRIHLSLS